MHCKGRRPNEAPARMWRRRRGIEGLKSAEQQPHQHVRELHGVQLKFRRKGLHQLRLEFARVALQPDRADRRAELHQCRDQHFLRHRSQPHSSTCPVNLHFVSALVLTFAAHAALVWGGAVQHRTWDCAGGVAASKMYSRFTYRCTMDPLSQAMNSSGVADTLSSLKRPLAWRRPFLLRDRTSDACMTQASRHEHAADQ